MAGVGELDAGGLEADPGGVRDRPDRHQAVAAVYRAAVRERHPDARVGALHPIGAGLGEHLHAAALEDLLEHARRVLVLPPRQHLVAAGDQRDLRPPRFMYAEANSAPVTPEPTTMRCSGSVFMS